jgi:hypothetical protein
MAIDVAGPQPPSVRRDAQGDVCENHTPRCAQQIASGRARRRLVPPAACHLTRRTCVGSTDSVLAALKGACWPTQSSAVPRPSGHSRSVRGCHPRMASDSNGTWSRHTKWYRTSEEDIPGLLRRTAQSSCLLDLGISDKPVRQVAFSEIRKAKAFGPSSRPIAGGRALHRVVAWVLCAVDPGEGHKITLRAPSYRTRVQAAPAAGSQPCPKWRAQPRPTRRETPTHGSCAERTGTLFVGCA